MKLEDIQSLAPENKIPLDKVGIKGFKYPVKVLDREKGIQHTVAEINLYVDLPARFKGTHMSRFIEVLNEFGREIHMKNVIKLLKRLKKKLSSRSAHIEMYFSLFFRKKSTCKWNSKSYGISGIYLSFLFSEKKGFNSRGRGSCYDPLSLF
jgi:GTP cyclohydrolase I